MKISVNWLRQYIDTDLDASDIAETLTLLGLEVEEIDQFGHDYEGFVAGKVKEVRPHPNADKLVICDVQLDGAAKQIVCGAPNVARGQKVPVATVGSTLPEPMPNGKYLTIKKMKLRGENSEGMICSEAELGLSDDHSGIMVLSDDIEPGTPLKDALDIEKDTVLEIGLTPNRPDAACHIGTARDLAAKLKKTLSHPYSDIKKSKNDLSDLIDISIENPDKCHRYTAFIVTGVTVKKSPNWLKQRLRSIGLRPINNVVDVTNYILHEIGQPLHAFDYDTISGKKIVVQDFDKDVNFTTLDDVERTVPPKTLFICDGEKPVAIAGVMGGKDSEVNEDTTTVLIESAYFDPSSTRKASKALALQTDSSYRFERGIDPTMQVRAAKRAAEMIADLTDGQVNENHTDLHPTPPQLKEVSVRVSRINHLLGTTLQKEEVSDILTRLQFSIQSDSNDKITCTVPQFRPDVSREVDLIEEVGRIYDFNNIPTPETAPFVTPEPLTEWEELNERVRDMAKTLGYKEISTNSLLSKKEASFLADEDEQIHTLNPVSQENTTLRTHLTAGFLKAARYNLHRNEDQLRFFELGHVFKKSNKGTWIDGVHEHTHLLLGLCGYKSDDNWIGDAKKFTIFDLKADVEAFFDNMSIAGDLTRKTDDNLTLTYHVENTELATLRIVDEETLSGFDVAQETFVAEIDITALHQLKDSEQDAHYKKVSKYPAFDFDAAFIVDADVRAGELEQTIRRKAGSALRSVRVFDVYEGENIGSDKKSIAFRLSFLDSNKTLTIKDVEPIIEKIVRVLEKEFDAKLRS